MNVKDTARAKLAYAVKRGVLIRPDVCPQCSGLRQIGRVEAHHKDYDRPLDVEWLCSACHKNYNKGPNMLAMSIFGPRNRYEQKLLKDHTSQV